jgi:hypothetical protein
VNAIKEGYMLSNQRKEKMISYQERKIYHIQGNTRKERCEGDACNSRPPGRTMCVRTHEKRKRKRLFMKICSTKKTHLIRYERKDKKKRTKKKRTDSNIRKERRKKQ